MHSNEATHQSRKVYQIVLVYQRVTSRGRIPVKATVSHFSSSPYLEAVKENFAATKAAELGVDPRSIPVQVLSWNEMSPEDYLRMKSVKAESRSEVQSVISRIFYQG